MKRNDDPTFAGVPGVKAKLREYLAQFESWAKSDNWEKFHSEHYDWWMFPVNRSSQGQGKKYTVYEGDIEELKSDPQFMADYRRGMELVAASFGWDLNAATYLSNPKPGQSWHNWPVRLYKMAMSARLFGLDTEFQSLKKLANDLHDKGQSFTYGGDLYWLFTTGIDPYAQNR